MRTLLLVSLLMVVFCAFAITPVSAHHPVVAKFDPGKSITISGVVTLVDWRNPHAHVLLDVTANRVITNWAVELESPIDLAKSGWSKDTVKYGETLTVQGFAARDGSPQLWGNSIVVAGTSRKLFDVAAPPPVAQVPSRPTPRGPDGKPMLGAALGEAGYWASPSSTVLMESGANVAMDGWGILKNIADVDKVAPFQRWARDLYELRQRRFLMDDPMYLACKPPGGPRQFQLAQGLQFVEDPVHQRIFVLLGSGNRNYRLIYLDGRVQRGQVRGDDDNPLYYGRSVAKWEGDTLVVDTKGFNEKFWFTNGGLPHTDQLHLIERLSRPDSNTLRYEVTVDDPGAYTRPFSASWDLKWVSGQEMPVYLCQDNRP